MASEESSTGERDNLALQVAQIALDIGGIVDPTPVADTASTLLALYREDWFGAAISAVGILPYIGDIAKSAKLQAYVATLKRAIRLAETSPAFRKIAGPILDAIEELLSRIPLASLAPELRKHVEILRSPFKRLGAGARAVRQLALVDRLLIARFGSVRVGALTRLHMERLVNFFHGTGVKQDKLLDFAQGIDMRQPVEIVRYRKGDWFVSDVSLPRFDAALSELKQGPWLRRLGNGQGMESTGITGFGKRHSHGKTELIRHRFYYQARQDVFMLRSKAAHVYDYWTDLRPGRIRKWVRKFDLDEGGRVAVKRLELSHGDLARGGGEQLLFNRRNISAYFEQANRAPRGASRARGEIWGE